MRTEAVTPRSRPAPLRRLSAGADVVGEGVHFRAWAPARRQVDVRVESGSPGLHPLAPEADGWFSGLVPGLGDGARYRYRLDGGDAFLENHDQVANSPRGERIAARTSPGRWRAMTAYLLLGPWTPLLFQGVEHGSRRPFLFFADHAGELARRVRDGRAEFMRQFPSFASADMRDRTPDLADPSAWERCKLERTDDAASRAAFALHRDLLELRRTDPTLRAQGADGIDGAVLAPEALCVRWAAPHGRDRLLVVNLGADLDLPSCAEPLVAAPGPAGWSVVWSSEDPRYGGGGTPAMEGRGLRVPGHAALLLAPEVGVG